MPNPFALVPDSIKLRFILAVMVKLVLSLASLASAGELLVIGRVFL